MLDRWREQFRMAIIQRMAALPDVCWADLVLWAIFDDVHPFYEIFKMRGTATYCGYCGKCPQMLWMPRERSAR